MDDERLWASGSPAENAKFWFLHLGISNEFEAAEPVRTDSASGQPPSIEEPLGDGLRPRKLL